MPPWHTGALTGRRVLDRLDTLTREDMAMTVDASQTKSPLSRRTFLHTVAGATAGLGAIEASYTPALDAATRTVTMLTFNHFVADSDGNLQKWAKEVAKLPKCQVKIDSIAQRDAHVKVAKEQETRVGHDVVLMFFSKPHLH